MVKESTGKDAGIGCLLVMIVIGAASYWLSRPGSVPTQGPQTLAAFEADLLTGGRGACREAVLQALNDPASVVWEPASRWVARVTSPNEVHIEPRLRARNAFGALVYGEYICEARLSDGVWSFTKLEQKPV